MITEDMEIMLVKTALGEFLGSDTFKYIAIALGVAVIISLIVAVARVFRPRKRRYKK